MYELTNNEVKVLIETFQNFEGDTNSEAFLFGVGAGIALEKHRIVGDV